MVDVVIPALNERHWYHDSLYNLLGQLIAVLLLVTFRLKEIGEL
jgi:hypothetical protein